MTTLVNTNLTAKKLVGERMDRDGAEALDERIVDHAVALFARHGFHNTAVQQIAEAIGYSRSVFLAHFSTGRLIYEADISAADTVAALVAQKIDGLLARQFRDQVFGEQLVDLALDRPGISTLLTSLIDLNPYDSARR